MAAAPQYATFYGVSMSGSPVAVDVYASDVAGAPLRFDSGAGASTTSDTFYTFPEPTIITDFSINTGMTDTKSIRLTANGQPTPIVLRYANHLNSLNNRPTFTLKMKAGSRLSALQSA